MPTIAGWIHLGMIAAGVVGTLFLLRWVWDLRDRPGAWWFLGVFSVQFVLLFGYGLGYVVFDPQFRYGIEVLAWIAAIWIGTLYLGFALGYTGRTNRLTLRWYGPIIAGAIAITAAIVTDPLHGLLISGFAVESVTGLSGVQYDRGPLVYLTFAVSAAQIAVGTALLVDTVVSYGRLYRSEAIAVGLSAVPPAIGYILWTFDLGPAAALNFVPALFLPHVALDAYAFVRSDMFDLHPATRRTGERAAIDDLANPVVIVDESLRVVTLNGAAESLFSTTKRQVLGEPLSACYDGDPIDPTRDTQTVSIRTRGRRQEFTIASKPLSTAADTLVGYTLVLQDVTEQRQRKQRLEVLNRILRHNLRNDLNVVVGMAQLLGDRHSNDDTSTQYVETIERNATALIDLGTTAQRVSTALESNEPPRPIQVESSLRSIAESIANREPKWEAIVEVHEGLTVETRATLFELVFENLIENGFEHNTAAEPRVTIEARSISGDDEIEITVSDNGPGIPDHELGAIEREAETALEHGSSLGLWVVRWGVTALGGDSSFDTGAEGTAITIRLPRAIGDRKT